MRAISILTAFVLAACGSSHADDAGVDGSTPGDLGPVDLGAPVDLGRDMPTTPDAGTDAGPSACLVGRACEPSVGCNAGLQCQGAVTTNVTYDTPDGGTASIPVVYFQDGTCTNAPFGTPLSMIGATGACDPTMASSDPSMAGRDGCDPCARCVKLQDPTPTTAGVAMCLARCTPSTSGSGGCRPGYTCDPATHACLPPQCESDTQCRLHRVDTNGNGVLDMADHTVLDPASTATCDTTTGRCVGTGSPAGHAGDACTVASECETGGVCLSELEAMLPGGYCTRLYCDLPGVACGAAESCRDLGGGLHLCLSQCSVGAESTADSLGPGGHGDTCRAGYACYYDERSGAGVMHNGACITGNYNPITTPNVGAHCTTDAECWSPHGLGKCVVDAGQDVCTVIECAGFTDPDAVCGAGSTCAQLPGFSVCARTCTVPDDCGAPIGGGTNLACVALVSGGPTVCWPGCQADSQCQSGHTCVGASLTSQGQCT